MSIKKTVHRYYADSLRQILDVVDMIGKEYKENGQLKPLWFRGHEYTSYSLVPNLFRLAKYRYNGNSTYSNNHLREDYRYQHFMSRNFDKTDYRTPNSVFEWQEIMQHFFSKTRLMDWSESLFSALEFAMEAYLIPYKNLEITEKRRKMQPTLWVLQPGRLNGAVYDALLEDAAASMHEKVFCGLDTSIIERIVAELKDHRDIYFSLEQKEQNFDNIVSLTALEDLRRSYIGREKEALESAEMNPFFYMLLRIYSDGVPVSMGTVPPLAIIHPYHSQRIRAQKGVFTVFPYYVLREQEEKVLNMKVGIDPIAMEYMPKCKEHLYEIRLTDPGRIAEEMRQIGYKSSDLYPDTQRVTQDMENMDFSI
ncbi:MAG: FRG domain-containing protein [Lachnospiraceae bacterium]|nr:FRG domain-containing protein [Lachnospiraceae bacterium]